METQQQFNFGITLDNLDGDTTLRNFSTTPNTNNNEMAAKSTSSQPTFPQILTTPNSDNYSLANTSNPKLCFATVLFKICAFVTYFFVGYLISNILTFILTITLSSLDFWIIKNLSGRILVGLRWNTVQDKNGKNIWKFESITGFVANPVDRSFFWTSIGVGVAIWGILFVVNVLQIDLLGGLLMGVNFGFSAANLYGYYLCRGEHHKKILSIKDRIKREGLMRLAGAVL